MEQLKPEFMNPLNVTLVDQQSAEGRGLWRLDHALLYSTPLLPERVLEVPSGFLTDFASVPRLPFMFMLSGGGAMNSTSKSNCICN